MFHGCCWGVGCGIAGMLAQKELLKAGATVNMPAGDGVVNAPTSQEVTVKLWKAGHTAPLTEAGLELVATDEREDQMALFLRRVVAARGGRVVDSKEFDKYFTPRC